MGSAGSVWADDWELVDPLDNFGYWPQMLANFVPAFWLGFEGLSRTYSARKRRELGLLEPLTCHHILLLGLTGVMLMFRYEPTVDRAYSSIQALEAEVVFGSLIRSVHHWSASALVVVACLHLVRVFLTGGFKKGRFVNWLIGIGLLLLTLIFNFTGYLLPWDQLAYWAMTVSTR